MIQPTMAVLYKNEQIFICEGDPLLISYKSEDGKPYRLDEFTVSAREKGCLFISTKGVVPAPEKNIRVWANFDTIQSDDNAKNRSGYTFRTTLMGISEDDGKQYWVLSFPESIRAIPNQRQTVRIKTNWYTHLQWYCDDTEQWCAVPAILANLSFGGCCVIIHHEVIKKLSQEHDINHVLGLMSAEHFLMSIQVPTEYVDKQTINQEAEKPPTPEGDWYEPFIKIEGWFKARLPRTQDGRKAEAISMAFINEHSAINKVITAVQRTRAKA